MDQLNRVVAGLVLVTNVACLSHHAVGPTLSPVHTPELRARLQVDARTSVVDADIEIIEILVPRDFALRGAATQCPAFTITVARDSDSLRALRTLPRYDPPQN
jgi:hypothetical protein